MTLSISFNSNSPASNRIFLQARSGSRTISSGASNVAASQLSDLRTALNCSVMGYSATDKGKVALVRIGQAEPTSGQSTLTLLSQNSTTAITSITLSVGADPNFFASNSRFSLYGIR
jgi:hypothetical protein